MEIAPCLRSDSEGASEEEEDHETSEQEDDYSGEESVSSAEQEGSLSGSEEQAKPQCPPNDQEEHTIMKDGEEDDHLSNSGSGGESAPRDTEDLLLPAEVKVADDSLCEGDSHPVSPPGGDTAAASDHQEDVQASRRRSIVVPMEGSGDESFEVILCGGEMEAPIAIMEAPTRAANGRKGKRKSRGEVNTNGDGSPPSKLPTELKSPVTGSAKKRKQTPSQWVLAKKKKQKQLRSKRKSTQDSNPSATMTTDILQPVSSAAPCQPPVPSITPLQAAHRTTPGPSSILKNWKSKSAPSKRTKNRQTDCNKPDSMGGILTADLNEVEVFSVENEWQSTSVPSKRTKQRTNLIRKMGNVFAADLNAVEVYSD